MKASEVFDLPVSVSYQFSKTLKIGGDIGGREVFITYHNAEQAKVAANCINHADALADALAVMVQNNWSTAHIRREAQKIAEDALTAYRGVK